MSRRKKKAPRAHKPQQHANAEAQPLRLQATVSASLRAAASSSFKRALAFVSASGLIALLLPPVYLFLAGNVSLDFTGAVDRAYEFQLRNETPSDLAVETFRVEPPLSQNVVYTTTRDVQATIDKDGRVTLPGGNDSYVPAAEFRELDGRILRANSSLNIRIPPLSNRDWVRPTAAIVDIRFELQPSNWLLRTPQAALVAAKLRDPAQRIRYLVVDNYWTISRAESLNEAIRIWCREDESALKDPLCRGDVKPG